MTVVMTCIKNTHTYTHCSSWNHTVLAPHNNLIGLFFHLMSSLFDLCVGSTAAAAAPVYSSCIVFIPIKQLLLSAGWNGVSLLSCNYFCDLVALVGEINRSAFTYLEKKCWQGCVQPDRQAKLFMKRITAQCGGWVNDSSLFYRPLNGMYNLSVRELNTI